jgi:hypothetical protein
MTSTIKVNTIQDSCGSALVTKCGSNITLGASGKNVIIACGATTVGMGRTGTVDWCTTAKTSPFTAVNGKGYFINTTSGSVTITLPSSPTAGDIVAVADYANTFDSNNLSIGRGGSKINGGCLDATLTTKGQSVTLVYVDGTRGWKTVTDSTANVTGEPNYVTATGGTVLTVGDYKTHIFTSDSNFVVSQGGKPSGSNTVEYLVVAGGGGAQCGGGGAGGWRSFASTPVTHPLNAPAGLPVSAQTYPVTVGAGGNGAYNPSPPAGLASNGANSIFSTITSTGGGSVNNSSGPQAGGSGGGAYNNTGPLNTGGAGNTPPVSPPQGNNGGSVPGPGSSSAGGGGANAAGGNANPGPRTGGEGAYMSDPFIGPTAPSYGTPGPVSSTRYFSGGGGGGANSPGFSPAAGGSGGGAPGPANSGSEPTSTTNATANTGGGGGGAWHGIHGNGGSGIVMIRYKYQN